MKTKGKLIAFAVVFFLFGWWHATFLSSYSSTLKALADASISSIAPMTASKGDNANWIDFWWMSNLKGTPLKLDTDGMIVFPVNVSRVWIDVGVHRRSEFLYSVRIQKDLFAIGFEPAVELYAPCYQERCAVLWAACTPKVQMVELYIQGFKGYCNSLLRPNSNTTAGLGRFKSCVKSQKDESGRDRKYQVPGIPLSSLLSRIPSHIAVEYIKIDAQGFDLEVMKGVLLPQPGENPRRQLPQVVSLEALNVTDRSKLLYQGQPTLDEIMEYMKGVGWTFVSVSAGTANLNEVDAFFALNESFASIVPSLPKSPKIKGKG